MRSCAVCGKQISKSDICNDCYKAYCLEGIPEWVQALIEMESHEQRYVNDREINFSSLGMDFEDIEMISLQGNGKVKVHPVAE